MWLCAKHIVRCALTKPMPNFSLSARQQVKMPGHRFALGGRSYSLLPPSISLCPKRQIAFHAGAPSRDGGCCGIFNLYVILNFKIHNFYQTSRLYYV
jgi:hypothetical protein